MKAKYNKNKLLSVLFIKVVGKRKTTHILKIGERLIKLLCIYMLKNKEDSKSVYQKNYQGNERCLIYSKGKTVEESCKY